MFSYKIDEDAELRLIELRHAEELNALVTESYEHIKEWSSWLTDKERPIEQTQDFIKRNLAQFAENKGFEICIWYHGEIAGQIGYNFFDWNDRRTEIGYWLGAPFQGKGLITKSCRVLIDYAFNELNLNRVEIRCGVENKKSRKIPEKLGFREEGIVRQAEWLHDHFIDLVIYGMLASEWQDKDKS
jgi:ribosomal-protein-serine acetyltransferase